MHTIIVDDTTFEREVLSSPVPVLVDFGAEWCPPCKLLKPILEAVARECAGALKVVLIDMDASPQAVRRYGVRAAPTLMMFRGGEKLAQRVGAMSKDRLLAFADTSR